MSELVQIAGPAGSLEAMLDRVPNDGARIAILCHPHPLYGGSMHDGILDAAASVLLNQGVSVLRFNFRGVGQSEGQHAGGEGEADDLSAVVAWALDTGPSESILLAGYSFGAAVAWRAAHTLPRLERLLLIAPPIGMMPFTSPAPACPVHVVYGDQDEYIDADAMASWAGITRHQVDGANHFFMGEWQGLSSALAAGLN